MSILYYYRRDYDIISNIINYCVTTCMHLLLQVIIVIRINLGLAYHEDVVIYESGEDATQLIDFRSEW